MNFIRSLSDAHKDLCNAQERGLLNWNDYSLLSDKLLGTMKLWNDNFNYDLECKQDFEDVYNYIKKKKGGKNEST